VIGHMKNEGHLGRCYLKGRAGDAANVILTAVGYNLRLVLVWLRAFLRIFLHALIQALAIPSTLKPGLFNLLLGELRLLHRPASLRGFEPSWILSFRMV
jgi:hypothetical protein